jgi:hypothetical protein
MIGHQIGRRGEIGRGLGLHCNFKSRGLGGTNFANIDFVGIDLVGIDLVCIDLGDFRFGLGLWLAGSRNGSPQRIKNAAIAGQGFELFETSVPCAWSVMKCSR